MEAFQLSIEKETLVGESLMGCQAAQGRQDSLLEFHGELVV
jgi:hypothetical protein